MSKKSAEVIVVRDVYVSHEGPNFYLKEDDVGHSVNIGQEMLHEHHEASGNDGSKSAAHEETSLFMAENTTPHLISDLMERICNHDNLNKALRKVQANKGAAGIDKMNVKTLRDWLETHQENLIQSLLNGSFNPSPVKGVHIPKPNGGTRQLGIPTVVDRFVQQAILQIIEPLFDLHFSDSSFGFRPQRSAHNALEQASKFVSEGSGYCVDIDLEKFFDKVNHDMLMARVARRIKDKRLLKLIRAFLNAGIMENGVLSKREEGTPQGGPLSPILSNILLDDLDKELEKRKHKFVRYADDCNIYVKSKDAAERVLKSVTKWIESKLKLKVNKEKSAAGAVCTRKFLGYKILQDGKLAIAPQSLKRFKQKVIAKTKRRTPQTLQSFIDSLNPLIRGWSQYFRMVSGMRKFTELDGWIRRRLRAIRLQQCKRKFTTAQFLINLGGNPKAIWKAVKSGKGRWNLSHSLPVGEAMNNAWFKSIGLISLEQQILKLKR